MPPAAVPAPLWRRRFATMPRRAWIVAAVMLVLALFLLVLATFDPAPFRARAERRLTALLGRRVTIGGITRVDAFSLAPRIRLTGVRVAQPAWAGRADMLVLGAAVVRLPVLPALFGHVSPTLLSLDGARLALVHDTRGRANWRSEERAHPDATSPDLATILLHDVRFTLLDTKRKLRMAGTIVSDGQSVRMRATGTHRGAPAQAALTGAQVVGGTAGKPWPFRAAFASPLARLTIDAVADRPLDFTRLAGAVTADGDDLDHVDDLLLIGLVPTQAVRASAHLVRQGYRWTLTDSRATIGRSDVAGTVIATRRDGRWRVDARVRSARFDFDDLANDAGLARAAAKTRRIGARLVPDTRIDISKLRDIDGQIVLHAARLLSARPSIYRSLDATLALDHARLTVAPLAFGLAHGRLEGRAVVAQPEGHAVPRLTVDLRLTGGRLEDIVTTGQVEGPLRGRLLLRGDGETIRDAAAKGDGSIAVAARGGSVSKTAAEMLGRDLGAAFGLMIGGSETRTPLNCLAGRAAIRAGKLTPSLFAIDTGVMRADGRGGVNLDGETIALTLDGRSKRPAVVRLPAPIEVGGTLSSPVVEMRGGSYRSAGTMLRALGNVVGGLFKRHDPPAPDADCGALIAEVGV